MIKEYPSGENINWLKMERIARFRQSNLNMPRTICLQLGVPVYLGILGMVGD